MDQEESAIEKALDALKKKALQKALESNDGEFVLRTLNSFAGADRAIAWTKLLNKLDDCVEQVAAGIVQGLEKANRKLG